MLKKLWLLGALSLSTLLVTSCQTTQTDAIDSTCIHDRPITYSSEDTVETINEVRAHNAGWRAICEKEKK